jgi:hypothetical protein
VPQAQTVSYEACVPSNGLEAPTALRYEVRILSGANVALPEGVFAGRPARAAPRISAVTAAVAAERDVAAALAALVLSGTPVQPGVSEHDEAMLARVAALGRVLKTERGHALRRATSAVVAMRPKGSLEMAERLLLFVTARQRAEIKI